MVIYLNPALLTSVFLMIACCYVAPPALYTYYPNNSLMLLHLQVTKHDGSDSLHKGISRGGKRFYLLF